MEDNNPKEGHLQAILALISDAQETVRFLETKTAICVTILSAHFIGLYSMLDDLTTKFSHFPWWFWVFLIILLACHTVIIALTYRIIAPRINPKTSVPHEPLQVPASGLFLINSKPTNFFGFSSSLNRSYGEFSNTFNELTELELVQALTFEYMKISFIRNAKASRFKSLARMLFIASGLFLGLLVIFFALSETPSPTLSNEFQQ